MTRSRTRRVAERSAEGPIGCAHRVLPPASSAAHKPQRFQRDVRLWLYYRYPRLRRAQRAGAWREGGDGVPGAVERREELVCHLRKRRPAARHHRYFRARGCAGGAVRGGRGRGACCAGCWCDPRRNSAASRKSVRAPRARSDASPAPCVGFVAQMPNLRARSRPCCCRLVCVAKGPKGVRCALPHALTHPRAAPARLACGRW
jgi:hypothetical protein